ncbi:MAG TPA: GNAT family N-acetyltransferase [Tepidisphaeraceae bacterium]
MSGLSNLWRTRDAPRPVVRPVAPGEIAAALSLLLGTPEHLAHPAAVADFEELSRQRGIDLTALQVATLDGRLAAAALPVSNAGRTVLLLVSPAGRSAVAADAVARCAEAVVHALPAGPVPLIQTLLDPTEVRAATAMEAAGLKPLATLLYLQRRLRVGRFPPPDRGIGACVHYSPATHVRFARAIEASYIDSMDCPPMRGLRSVDDVIAGHRATGEFDPDLWFCLTDGEQELGVLLLAPVTAQPMTELVYLGLAPAARGRRLGDALIKLALHLAAERGDELLTLAVDSSNIPALRAYYRNGLAEIARRVALIRPPALNAPAAAAPEARA